MPFSEHIPRTFSAVYKRLEKSILQKESRFYKRISILQKAFGDKLRMERDRDVSCWPTTFAGHDSKSHRQATRRREGFLCRRAMVCGLTGFVDWRELLDSTPTHCDRCHVPAVSHLMSYSLTSDVIVYISCHVTYVIWIPKAQEPKDQIRHRSALGPQPSAAGCQTSLIEPHHALGIGGATPCLA